MKQMKQIKHNKHMKTISGGFSNSSSKCNIATVKEPGFSVSALNSVPGINISGSSAAIYRPNCQANTYQAMIP